LQVDGDVGFIYLYLTLLTVLDRIVNRPPNPGNTNKGQEVTETDMFLLGAIEKLVHRMDFLEKRVQRTEDMLYQLLAGSTSSGKLFTT